MAPFYRWGSTVSRLELLWGISLPKTIKQFLFLEKTCLPRDFEILGWCPAGPVLSHGEKVPLQPWFATLLVMVSQ